MAIQSADELIDSGPSKDQTPPPSNVEAQSVESTKVTSAEPTKVSTDNIDKVTGDPTDPLVKFRGIVGKEKSEISKPSTEAKEDKADAVEDKTKVDEDIPVTARPRKPLVQQLQDEDLSDFDEQGLKFAKQMSKEAREWAKARLKEVKEYKEKATQAPAGIPPNWFEHEDAYVLHPDFRSAVETVEKVRGEQLHWENQLVKILKGEKWIDIVADGNGGLTTVERDPTPEAQRAVERWSQKASRLLEEAEFKARSVQTSFRDARAKVQGGIKNIEDTFFPQYKDPKTLENDEDVKKVRSLFERFQQHGSPTAGFTYKLYKWAMETWKENQELQQQLEGKAFSAKERKLAGPSSGELAEGGGKSLVGDDKPFDISEFERLKRV